MGKINNVNNTQPPKPHFRKSLCKGYYIIISNNNKKPSLHESPLYSKHDVDYVCMYPNSEFKILL